MSQNWRTITATWWRALTPPPDLTVSQWADAERRLSAEASAEPGRWVTARAEYQRGIMDAVSDPSVRQVVFIKSAQVGATEIVGNICGFYMSQDPSPLLVIQPTLEMGQTWSKDRLAPMIRDTPALHGLVGDARSRDGDNTLMHKAFPGGHVTIAGANSPAGLASRPIRVVLCDEVDRYPASAGTEGDPVSLAFKRTTTFWNRKMILVSTPGIKGESRIEPAFEESDQRRFYVPCPDCGHRQTLKWSQVRWDRDEEDGKATTHHPETAEYACEECGSLWSDARRWKAISKGEWRAGAPFNGVAGFHINEIYSPWVKLSETVQAFIDAKSNPERLKAFINTALGETWEERGEGVEASGLDALREAYGPEDLPDEVAFATAGVDTQGDRLEIERVCWDEIEQSWGAQYDVLYGDPAQQQVWDDLDALLLEPMHTKSGRVVRVEATAIDSGGHHAAMVLKFCRERFRRRVYAIKGQGGAGVPVWPRKSSKSRHAGMVFSIGVDTIKDMVYSRWGIPSGEPGACHLPADPETGYDEGWMAQVTSEQKQTRYKAGRPYGVWFLPAGKRNEGLDCRVYATAAMRALPGHMRHATAQHVVRDEHVGNQPAPPPKAQPPKRRGNSFLGTQDWSL